MAENQIKDTDGYFSEAEMASIKSEFNQININETNEDLEYPIHFVFRAKVRVKEVTMPKECVVAVSPHFFGLFESPSGDKEKPLNLIDLNQVSKTKPKPAPPPQPAKKGEAPPPPPPPPPKEKALIHISKIQMIANSKNFTLIETTKESGYGKITIKSGDSQDAPKRFAQILYRNIYFSYAINSESDSLDLRYDDPASFPPIEKIYVSPSQQFQFAYFAQCTSEGTPYNHEVVRYIHNLIISENTLIDISQLPLGLTSNIDPKSKEPAGASQKEKTSKSQNAEEGEKTDEEVKPDETNLTETKSGKSRKKSTSKKSGKGTTSQSKPDNDTTKSQAGEQTTTTTIAVDTTTKKQLNIINDLKPIFESLKLTAFISGICATNLDRPLILESFAKLIESSPSLRIVHLENCNIKTGLDELIETINKLPRSDDEDKKFGVSYWNLSFNQIEHFEKFADILTNSENELLYLNLSYCKIPKDATKAIFNALSKNSKLSTIQHLLYAGNELPDKDKSGQIDCISSFLKGSSNLEYLDFSHLQTEDDLLNILTTLQHSQVQIKSLILCGCKYSPVAHDALQKLIRGPDTNPAKPLKSLELLDLSGMIGMRSEHVRDIVETIGDQDVKLDCFTQDSTEIGGIDGTGFKIYLDGLNLCGENLLPLISAFLNTDLNKWKSLSLNSNKMTTKDLNALFACLKRMKNLRELSLNDNFDSTMDGINVSLSKLLELKKIAKISVAGGPEHKLQDKLDLLLNNIARNPGKILELDISNNNSQNSTISNIKNILITEGLALRALYIDGNCIPTTDSLVELAESAEKCKSLITFPFPVADAQRIIKKLEKRQQKKIIQKLSDIQIRFIQATIRNRMKLNKRSEKQSKKGSLSERPLPMDLPFPATERVKELVQNISKKITNRFKDGNVLLTLHTRVCEQFSLPLPYQQLGDLPIQGGVELNLLEMYGEEDYEKQRIAYQERDTPQLFKAIQEKPNYKDIYTTLNTRFHNDLSTSEEESTESESSQPQKSSKKKSKKSRDYSDESSEEEPRKKSKSKKKSKKTRDESDDSSEEEEPRKKSKSKKKSRDESEESSEEEEHRKKSKSKKKSKKTRDESDSDFEVGTKKKSKRHAESDDSEEYRRKKSKKHSRHHRSNSYSDSEERPRNSHKRKDSYSDEIRSREIQDIPSKKKSRRHSSDYSSDSPPPNIRLPPASNRKSSSSKRRRSAA